MKKNVYTKWVLVLLAFSTSIGAYSQNISFRLGQSQTSTPFRANYFGKGGNHVLFTPKTGWAGEIGVEYAIKPKSSFYSGLAFYQSGATQEDYKVLGQDPFYYFNLKNNEYTYNSWSLNTNYNMEVWRDLLLYKP